MTKKKVHHKKIFISNQIVHAMHSSQRTTKENIIHFLRANVIKGFFLAGILILGFFQSAQAQSIPNPVLKDGAFEAEFFFDVYFSIQLCDGERTVLINAYNESGIKTEVGFDIQFADASGAKQTLQVPIFSSKRGEIYSASCASDTHSFLRFKLNEKIDLNTLQGDIKFYSK